VPPSLTRDELYRRGRQIVDSAVARLASEPRRPQRDLQRLIFAWSAYPHYARSVRKVVLAVPDEVALAHVVRHVDSPTPGVSDAAFGALRAASLDLGDAHEVWEPARLWNVEGAREAIDAALRHESGKRRLLASHVASAVPLATFPFRALAEADPIYTVRWRAIRALAVLGAHDGLADLFVACLPRDAAATLERQRLDGFSSPHGHELWRTSSELEAQGVGCKPLRRELERGA
jgi:hypothetical protein